MSKISELSDGGSLVSTDYLIAVRSGGNVKVRMDEINVDQVDLGDNEFIRLGNSQDLTLVHDASNSIINQAGIGDLLIQKAGSTKLTVNSTGIDVTGTVTADGLTVSASAATANITSTSGGATLNLTHPTAADGYSIRQGNANADDFRIFEGSKIKLNITTGGDISFYEDTGTTAKFFWDASAESLGIGTTSPVRNVSVLGSASATMSFQNSTTGSTLTDGLFIGNDASLAYLYNYEATPIVFATSATERMRIDASGKVGIGMTPASGHDLAVYDTTNTSFSLHNSTTGTADSDGFRLQAIGSDAYVVNNEAGNLRFYTSAAEAMRIDASGNLLVGTTVTPNTLLGATATQGLAFNGSSGYLVAAASGQATAYFNRQTSDGTIADFRKDGTTVGSIGNDGNDLTINSQGGLLKFDLAGTRNYTFDNVRIYPQTDNARNLGVPTTNRFADAYIVNGVTTGSDGNDKQDIEALSDAEQRVAVACKGLLRKWRWKDAVEAKGDDARIHFGIIAQDLQAAFEAEGLDAGRYAMFMSNTWTDEETGEERTRLGVRYHELLAFIIAAI